MCGALLATRKNRIASVKSLILKARRTELCALRARPLCVGTPKTDWLDRRRPDPGVSFLHPDWPFTALSSSSTDEHLGEVCTVWKRTGGTVCGICGGTTRRPGNSISPARCKLMPIGPEHQAGGEYRVRILQVASFSGPRAYLLRKLAPRADRSARQCHDCARDAGATRGPRL